MDDEDEKSLQVDTRLVARGVTLLTRAIEAGKKYHISTSVDLLVISLFSSSWWNNSLSNL